MPWQATEIIITIQNTPVNVAKIENKGFFNIHVASRNWEKEEREGGGRRERERIGQRENHKEKKNAYVTFKTSAPISERLKKREDAL